MKFAAAMLLLFALLCSAPQGRAQGLQVDLEEFRRLQGEVADLRDAKTADQKRIAELSRKVEQLQSALRNAEERTTLKLGDAITRDDLKKIIDRIAEVDDRRENDKKVILEQFEKVTRIVAQPSLGDRGTKRTPREPEKEKEVEQIEGTFIEHKVKDGDIFSQILEDFNVALKNEGRPIVTTSQVKKVNPKLDLNRIRVGQTILLPVPDKR
ncbi:MAG: LysM peptidoglycan-binding domain-containing protein [Limisphaerales bacterium]